MTWHWLNRKELEGKEIEVLREVEPVSYKGRKPYLIKEPNRSVSAKDCIVVSE